MNSKVIDDNVIKIEVELNIRRKVFTHVYEGQKIFPGLNVKDYSLYVFEDVVGKRIKRRLKTYQSTVRLTYADGAVITEVVEMIV